MRPVESVLAGKLAGAPSEMGTLRKAAQRRRSRSMYLSLSGRELGEFLEDKLVEKLEQVMGIDNCDTFNDWCS